MRGRALLWNVRRRLSRGRNGSTLMSRRVRRSEAGKLELRAAPNRMWGRQGRSDRRSMARDNSLRDEQIGIPGSLYFTSPHLFRDIVPFHFARLRL
jgi:hypothetical protein